jgi:ferritin
MSVVSQKMQDAINDQIRKEFYSAYLYLSMSAHFEAETLKGFAAWMRVQAKEEVGHGMKLLTYMHDRGGRVLLQGLDAPPADFGNPLAIFQQAYAHEQEVTKSIHALYALAVEEHDYATQSALIWFVNEQVEEENTAAEIVAQLEMAGESRSTLLYLDRQFGKRGA